MKLPIRGGQGRKNVDVSRNLGSGPSVIPMPRSAAMNGEKT
jgi:hypothetical protein